MKLQPLVSVIVPVYNAFQYVGKAIESIIGQDYENLEIILIDDGATDGSGEIVDRFAQTDSRIVALHQVNGGICNARNHGLKVARGKYLAFCDHDDEMQPGSIRRAVYVAEGNGASLVKFSYRTDHYVRGELSGSWSQTMPKGEYPIHSLINEYSLFNLSIRALWNGIYLADIVRQNHITFDESVRFGTEDFLFNLEYIRHINSIWMLPELGYVHYARVEQSTDEKFNLEKLDDQIKTAVAEREYLQGQENFAPTNWVWHQAQYLGLYLGTLLHPDNTMSFREKCNRLRDINQPEKLGLQCKKMYCLKLIRKAPKFALMVTLFNARLYGALIATVLLHHCIR